MDKCFVKGTYVITKCDVDHMCDVVTMCDVEAKATL